MNLLPHGTDLGDWKQFSGTLPWKMRKKGSNSTCPPSIGVNGLKRWNIQYFAREKVMVLDFLMPMLTAPSGPPYPTR
jgi:hypothetical protein